MAKATNGVQVARHKRSGLKPLLVNLTACGQSGAGVLFGSTFWPRREWNQRSFKAAFANIAVVRDSVRELETRRAFTFDVTPATGSFFVRDD